MQESLLTGKVIVSAGLQKIIRSRRFVRQFRYTKQKSAEAVYALSQLTNLRNTEIGRSAALRTR